MALFVIHPGVLGCPMERTLRQETYVNGDVHVTVDWSKGTPVKWIVWEGSWDNNPHGTSPSWDEAVAAARKAAGEAEPGLRLDRARHYWEDATFAGATCPRSAASRSCPSCRSRQRRSEVDRQRAGDVMEV